jgi:predicted phosphodiesterase
MTLPSDAPETSSRGGAALAALAILSVCGCSRAAVPERAPDGPVSWVELTAEGAELRATATDGRCPTAMIDGSPAAMTVRAGGNQAFPAICVLRAPPTAHSLGTADHPVSLPGGTPRRIVVIGDTGCRVRGVTAQDCNHPLGWPFARVAALAAAQRPDLVIHVGDYYYREGPCPLAKSICAGSPHGDRFETWRTDLFDPAAPLLERAPVVFVRGNHEDCRRGGDGWARMLDAGPWRGACPETDAPFVVRLGELSLGVIDSSVAGDREAASDDVARMVPQFERLKTELGPGESFLLTHRPIWAAAPVSHMGPFGTIFVGLNATEQAAARGRIAPGVSMVVSGHVHHFAAYSYGPSRPAQLVAGEGGANLVESPRFGPNRAPLTIDGMTAAKVNFARYGYVLMTRSESGWTIDAHDLDDRIVARCHLVRRDLACDTDLKGRR